jgi:prolyl-tRNA editing enzyme YbaK/EbsC (Cys-tRNA(Pro) deacylase)
MSYEAARAHLEKYGLEDRIQLFDVSSATVELAAQAVGVEGARIAKTLSFKVDNGCILILAAGDARIDNKKYKATFHKKASMPSPEEVLEQIGHPVGGVCPFGIKEGVPVYLDESLKRFDIVYPAAGTGNSAVKLTIEELYKSAEATGWVDVCKLPEA